MGDVWLGAVLLSPRFLPSLLFVPVYILTQPKPPCSPSMWRPSIILRLPADPPYPSDGSNSGGLLPLFLYPSLSLSISHLLSSSQFVFKSVYKNIWLFFVPSTDFLGVADVCMYVKYSLMMSLRPCCKLKNNVVAENDTEYMSSAGELHQIQFGCGK